MIIQDKDFTGSDVCNLTSLFEYGLLWQYQGNGEYYFIYGVRYGEAETGEALYNRFDHCTMSKKDILEIIEEDWFNYKSFVSFLGYDPLDEKEVSIGNLVFDMVTVHGYTNIFSSSYWSTEIEIQDESGNICNWKNEYKTPEQAGII